MASKHVDNSTDLVKEVYKHLGKPLQPKSKANKQAVGTKTKKKPVEEDTNSRMQTCSSRSKQSKASEIDGSPTPHTITPVYLIQLTPVYLPLSDPTANPNQYTSTYMLSLIHTLFPTLNF